MGTHSSQRGTAAPHFSTHVYCGQTTGCIRITFGTEVGLGPGDIVLDGDPAPPEKGAQKPPPLFGPCLLCPNGWMDQDTTWYRGRPRLRRYCVRLEPRSPHGKRQQQPPLLAYFAVARSSVSASAELLFSLCA